MPSTILTNSTSNSCIREILKMTRLRMLRRRFLSLSIEERWIHVKITREGIKGWLRSRRRGLSRTNIWQLYRIISEIQLLTRRNIFSFSKASLLHSIKITSELRMMTSIMSYWGWTRRNFRWHLRTGKLKRRIDLLSKLSLCHSGIMIWDFGLTLYLLCNRCRKLERKLIRLNHLIPLPVYRRLRSSRRNELYQPIYTKSLIFCINYHIQYYIGM